MGLQNLIILGGLPYRERVRDYLGAAHPPLSLSFSPSLTLPMAAERDNLTTTQRHPQAMGHRLFLLGPCSGLRSAWTVSSLPAGPSWCCLPSDQQSGANPKAEQH